MGQGQSSAVKLTELIAHLQLVLEKEGNLDVYTTDPMLGLEVMPLLISDIEIQNKGPLDQGPRILIL